MEEIRIVQLDTAGDFSDAAIGAKAANLIRMKRASLPVPEGFCICGRPYLRHAGTAVPESRLKQALAGLQDKDLRRTREILAEIRQHIVDTPVDDALAGAILANCKKLNASALAVRSSATAEAALDLWRLARKANDLPELRNAILAKKPFTDIAPTLDTDPKAAPFRHAWSKFLSDHGHHCRAEIELLNPRWSEQPDYILSVIRGYIESIDRTDPVRNHGKIAADRRRIETDSRRKLRNPIKRWFFNRILSLAQTGSVWRENIKSELVKIIALMRGALLELGQRLHADNTLEDPNDIFFLRLEEMPSVAQGVADFDIKRRVASRRAEYDKWTAITPPSTIIGTFAPEDYIPEPVRSDVQTLESSAVSPGIATGKARVILHTDSDEQVLAGEVLVAPFTDPGWTPYFIPAAAVVTERGGLLSHGAIVARELGIPCVTNVGPVTQIIKTGRTIHVDGNAGTIKILD